MWEKNLYIHLAFFRQFSESRYSSFSENHTKIPRKTLVCKYFVLFLYLLNLYIFSKFIYILLRLNFLLCILLSWHLFRFQIFFILMMKFSKMRFRFTKKIPLISEEFELFLNLNIFTFSREMILIIIKSLCYKSGFICYKKIVKI